MPVIITLNPAKTDTTHVGSNGERSTQTIPIAATPNLASSTLYQYNLPEANSLHPATGLNTLFPGLKLHAKREVDTQHPAELVRQCRPQPAQGDHLVIKSPGEEHHILHALAEADLLKTFSQLSVLAHETPLYEAAEPAHLIVEWLAEQGFEYKGNHTEDPDWPVWQFKRNPLQSTVDELRNQLQTAQAKCQAGAEGNKALEQRLKEAEQHLKETEQHLAESRNRLQQAEQKAKASQAAAAKAEEEKKATVAKLNETLQAEKQAQQGLKAELETHKAELETHKAELETRKAEFAQTLAHTNEQHQQTQRALAQAQAEHKAQKEALEKQSQQHQALAQQKTTLEAAQAELKARAEQAEQKAKASQAAAAKAEEEKKATVAKLNETLQAEKQAQQGLKAELETHKAELETRKAEFAQTLAHTNEQLQQTQRALAQAQAEHKAKKEALEKQSQQHQALAQQKTTLETAQAELKVRAEQAEAENRTLKNQLHGLEQQLEAQSGTQSALKTMQERMEYLFGQNTLQLEQAANALGQHVSQTAESTARELEAGIALQQLAPGTATISQSGLPKSAALELANKLNTKNYDLVIEMGSGSITHFIAQTLKNAGRELAAPSANQKELSHYVEASEDDLPKRILSVDHNRSRQKELAEKLTHAGLASYVSLQFAPLVPAQYNGKEQLFYDCGTRLQQIAHLFDSRQARILMVVNIDASETAPDLSAALPAVLQYLSAHQLDVIAHAPAQQQLTGQWESLLNERGLDHTAAKALGTGQVQHITVNP